MGALAQAYVQIIPTTDGIKGQLENTLGEAADSAGEKAGKSGGNKFSAAMGGALKVAAGGAAAVTAIGASFVAASNSTAAYADNVDKMSQKIGISAKSYQELDFIARHSGTSADIMQNGMKTLRSAMDKASEGADKQSAIFNQLGVSVTNADGSFRSQEDVMWDTMNALTSVSDETERTTMATTLFGRAGTELGPLLNSGADGIAEMRQQAEDLGIVMSDDAIAAGVTYTDTMQNVTDSLNAVKNQIGVAVMPMVQTALDFILENMPTIKEVATNVFEALQAGMTVVIGLLQTYVLPVMTQVIDFIVNTVAPAVISAWQGTIQPALQTAFEAIKTAWDTVLHPAFDAIVNVVQNVILPAFQNVWQGIIQPLISTVFSAIAGFWSNILAPCLTAITSAVNALADNWDTIWNACKATVQAVFDGVASVWSSVLQPCIDAIGTAITTVQNTWDTAVNALLSTVTDVFNNIKSFISKKVEWLKGVFDFNWELPKIKLPHFSIVGEFNWNPPSVPHLGVDWYSKAMGEPYMFTQPTLFGAGEAGDEMIYGKSALMRDIRQATGELNIDYDRLGEATANAIANAGLGISLDRRELGRVVRKAVLA